MKTIICYRCKKTIEVPDDWTYKTCSLCKTKEKARKQVQKEKRRLDRQSRNKIKELKLEKAMNFAEWSRFAKEKLNNPNPTWEQYLEYLKQRKEHEIYDTAERESFRLRIENKKKYALICPELYPFSHERQCYAFRLSRLNGSEDLQHLDLCESCRDWNYAFVNDVLPEPESEKDKSWIQTPRDDSELPFERSKTIPDHSLDRFKPKPEPETPTLDKIRVEPIQQPDLHSEPEHQPQETSKDDLNNILSEYDAKKKRDSEESDGQQQNQ